MAQHGTSAMGRRSYVRFRQRRSKKNAFICIVCCRWCFRVVRLLCLGLCAQYPGAIEVKGFLASIASQQDCKIEERTYQTFFVVGPAQLGWRPFTLLKIAVPSRVSTLSQIVSASTAQQCTVGIYTCKMCRAMPF